jgi:uncharacterized protein (DUF1684 family)
MGFLWGLILVALMADATDPWEIQEAQWRMETTEKLKKNWLVVVGLDWLKAGENSIGSGKEMKVRLPQPAPEKLGTVYLSKRKAEIKFTSAKNVKMDGQPVKTGKVYPLNTDMSGKKNVVEIDSVQFYLIERPNGVGVRVKDQNSQTLKDFRSLNWWAPNKQFVITGEWKPFAETKILRVPDILGNTNEEKITGSVVFKIGTQDYELFPTREGDDLFFVFKDSTSGKESYGTGRFLEAKVGKDNKVELNFNRAYNPPCAQINYATCPIPPPENVIKAYVTAGEKTPKLAP